MPAEVILFKTRLRGKLKEKHSAIPSGALLLVLLLTIFFLCLLLNKSYLEACTIVAATTIIAWPILTLVQQQTRSYVLELTEKALSESDRHGNKSILLLLCEVTHFRYYSTSFDEDDYYRVLQAFTPRGTVDLPLSALTRCKEKQLLLSLRQAGFSVFLVYENQELGNTYPGI